MGGGGSKQTSVSEGGVPDWARPYIESAAQDAQGLYKSGALENVAGETADQTAAQDAIRDQAGSAGNLPGYATGAFKDAATGQGVFGAGAYGDVANQLQPQIDKQVQTALGQQAGQFSRSGNLGGARAQAASASTAGNIAANLASQEVAAQRQGVLSGAQGGLGAAGQAFGQQAAANQALAQSGTAQQQQDQNEADAQYQGIQRLFGLINPNTVGQKGTTTTTGGGK